MEKEEKNKKILYQGNYLRLIKNNNWEYVERMNISGIVVIVAVTDEKKIILIEQYRPPVNSNVLELPAGLVGDIPGEEHESLETAAERELFEETGYKASSFHRLIEGPPSAGLSKEITTFYLAKGLKKEGDGGGDHTEDIKVFELSENEIYSWIESKKIEGVLIDPKVYTGIYFAFHHK